MSEHPALRVVSPFDALVFHDDHGTERWSARDLMGPLGYERWDNFHAAVRRAKNSAANSMGEDAGQDQFRGVTKMVDLGSGSQRPIVDYHLSRYAAYLVAMNGDPTKPEIAAALGEKKARAVIASGATVVASGNIGCLTQLAAHLERLGSSIKVHHTFQVLRDAYTPQATAEPSAGAPVRN